MQGQTNLLILKNKVQRLSRSSMTDAERRLWQRLRGKQLYGRKFRRQHPYGDYILDFVCLRLSWLWRWMGASMLSNDMTIQVAMPI